MDNALSSKTDKPYRLLHLDFLRIISIFLVVFNHTNTKGYLLFTQAQQSPLYWGYLFFSVFDKVAVPLFFMISGALLLGKKETFTYIVRYRFWRFFLVLIIFSFVQYCFQIEFDPTRFSLYNFFSGVYSTQYATAYWYLYAYLGYIIMLPILRKFVQTIDDQTILYFIAVFILIKFILPSFSLFVWQDKVKINSSFNVGVLNDSIFYPIIGYFLEHKLSSKYFTKKTLYILSCISIFAIIITCLTTTYSCTLSNDWTSNHAEKFHKMLIVLPTITLYLVSKYFFCNRPLSEKTSSMLKLLGGTTFGIMLIENLLRELTEPLFWILYPYFRTFLSCCIWVTAVCILGGLITLILKRIPVLKKLL